MLTQGMSFSSEIEAMWLRNNIAADGILLHGAFAELFKTGEMHNFYVNKNVSKCSRRALAEQLWKRFSARYALRKSGLCSEFRSRVGEQARAHLEEAIERYDPIASTSGILQMLYIDEFLGKITKYSRLIWSRRIPIHFSFAYPPLVDLILTVRHQDKLTNKFAANLLASINPMLAAFPDSNTGARIGASRFLRECIHVADWTRGKLSDSRARSDHQDFSGWMNRISPSLDIEFSEMNSVRPIFDTQGVRRLIDRSRARDDSASRALHFLLGLGVLATGKDVAY